MAAVNLRAVRAIVERSCLEQGKAFFVSDAGALAKVAALLEGGRQTTAQPHGGRGGRRTSDTPLGPEALLGDAALAPHSGSDDDMIQNGLQYGLLPRQRKVRPLLA
jgi:hypothetical protein